MPRGPFGKMPGGVLLLAAAWLAAMAQVSATPLAFRLALGGGGGSMQLQSPIVTLAFDFGQKCAKSDRCLEWR